MFVPVPVSVEENPYPMEALCCEIDQSQSKQPVMGGPGCPLGRVPSPGQGALPAGPMEAMARGSSPTCSEGVLEGAPTASRLTFVHFLPRRTPIREEVGGRGTKGVQSPRQLPSLVPEH